MAKRKIPEEDMKKFVDALKKSIRQRQNRQTFKKYMEKALGPDIQKWRRIIDGNRVALGEIIASHIDAKGELIGSAEVLNALFLRTQSKGADCDFLLDLMEFLKKNKQDAFELKKGL
jgi:hypothetical protein